MGNEDAKNEGQAKSGKTHKLANELGKVRNKTCGAKCCRGWLKAVGVLLSIAVALVGLAVIAASVTTAIATKLFSSDLSGRLVAYVVLAVSAALALCMGIYAAVGLFKTKNKKSLKIAGTTLFLLAIVQAIICGVSVKVTDKDDVTLAESLRESFNLANAGNPKHMKIWAITSNDLQCCGLYGPEDYRILNTDPAFPPDVPVYCCPNYNSNQSQLLQETARQICKSTVQYYKVGCGVSVKTVVEKTASMVLGVTITLIVLEVILSIHVHLASLVFKKQNKLQGVEVENRTGEAGAPNAEHS